MSTRGFSYVYTCRQRIANIKLLLIFFWDFVTNKNKFTIVSKSKSISDWKKFVTHCDDIDVIVEIILNSVSLLVILFFVSIFNHHTCKIVYKTIQMFTKCTKMYRKNNNSPTRNGIFGSPTIFFIRSLFFRTDFFLRAICFIQFFFFSSRSSFSCVSNEIFNTHRKWNSINFTLTSNWMHVMFELQA